jgi:ribosomal protein S18 acetylase RimI-like enzyme
MITSDRRSESKGRLSLVVCAASPARHTTHVVDLLTAQRWQVTVYATQEAAGWLDHHQLASAGASVRVHPEDAPDGEQAPSLVVVAPATFHTINAITAGLNNSLALHVVHDAIGAGVPLVVAPHVNEHLAAHPPYRQSLRQLNKLGATTVTRQAVCDGGCPPQKHWPAVQQVLARWQPPRSGVTIRAELPDDTLAVAHTHVASWKAGYASLVPARVLEQMDPREQAARRLAALSRHDDTVTLVALRAGAVLGYVTVRPDPGDPGDGQVWACYTHPDTWGTGVAGDLLQRGLLLLTQPMVRLWLLANNTRALSFYRRHGFRPDGQRDLHTFTGTEVSLPIIRMTLHRN